MSPVGSVSFTGAISRSCTQATTAPAPVEIINIKTLLGLLSPLARCNIAGTRPWEGGNHPRSSWEACNKRKTPNAAPRWHHNYTNKGNPPKNVVYSFQIDFGKILQCELFVCFENLDFLSGQSLMLLVAQERSKDLGWHITSAFKGKIGAGGVEKLAADIQNNITANNYPDRMLKPSPLPSFITFDNIIILPNS